MMLKKAAPLASLLLLMGAQGCNVTVASTDSCSTDTSYICRDGNAAYYCTGSATPQISGYGCETTGYGDFCCYPFAADTCVTAAVGCVAAAQGYACTGSAQPEYYTSGDVCSTDGAGNYCCWSSQCHYDYSVTARCTSGTTGYSCTGSQTPYTADPNLVCSEATAGRGGETQYCCYTAASPAPATSTCSQDSTVTGCQASSYGFSCTGSDTPDSDYSNLSCSTGTPGSGATLYCCTYQ